jgi:hypothetical protein
MQVVVGEATPMCRDAENLGDVLFVRSPHLEAHLWGLGRLEEVSQ